jgi:hypothetical protein
MRFVARLINGDRMSERCREFGISRKTGHKIWDRYREVGIHGLSDRGRRPYRMANQLPLQLENTIVRLRRLSRMAFFPRIAGSAPARTAPILLLSTYAGVGILSPSHPFVIG